MKKQKNDPYGTVCDRKQRALKCPDIHFADKSLCLRHLKTGVQAIVPLPDIVADALRRYMQRHALSPDSVLFPTEAGIPFNATALNRFMHKYARRIGLSAGGVHVFVGRSLSLVLNRFAGVCADVRLA